MDWQCAPGKTAAPPTFRWESGWKKFAIFPRYTVYNYGNGVYVDGQGATGVLKVYQVLHTKLRNSVLIPSGWFSPDTHMLSIHCLVCTEKYT